MKYSKAKQGRTFVLRLEDGEIIHEVIENFAKEKSITRAYTIALGGIDKDSKIITGPIDGRAETIIPNLTNISNVYEISGTGTIFPNKNNNPILHMHISCGRGEDTKTGCIRSGVKVWQVLEVIIVELIDNNSKRLLNTVTGFELLEPQIGDW